MSKEKVFKGLITFNIDSGHPDVQCVENIDDELCFEDIYTLSSDYYINEEEMINFIKQDLSIVAGGGYSKENIRNVKFDIKIIR